MRAIPAEDGPLFKLTDYEKFTFYFDLRTGCLGGL